MVCEVTVYAEEGGRAFVVAALVLRGMERSVNVERAGDRC
jgi:hypothetical protein